jgi:hypothetical protein
VIDDIRRWAVSPIVGEPYVREIDVAPEALTNRLRARLNAQPRRMFGVLKVRPEFVGLVSANEFVVWERRQHATRAVGRVRGRRGGSRVEAHIALTRRARALSVVFFALFLVVSVAMLLREGGIGIGPPGLAVLALGIALSLVLFYSASLGQRAALRRFLDAAFTPPSE